jgi:hypothetical protein
MIYNGIMYDGIIDNLIMDHWIMDNGIMDDGIMDDGIMDDGIVDVDSSTTTSCVMHSVLTGMITHSEVWSKRTWALMFLSTFIETW